MTWRELNHNDEFYTYEYFQRENVCRICWQCNASIQFSMNILQNEHENDFQINLQQFINIGNSSIAHINKICEDCSREIDNFCVFKKFCKTSEDKLCEIIEKHAQSSENSQSDIKVFDSDFKLDSIESFLEIHINDTTKKHISKNVTNKKKIPKKHGNACFDCSICHLNFDNKDDIVKHNSDLHGVEENGTVFKCFGCDKRFKSRRRRLGHESKFCQGLKDGYKCPICVRYLPRRRLYEIHMRNHRNNRSTDLPDDIFNCKKCVQSFKCKKSLNEHYLLVHESQKHFVCDSCGRVFTRQDYLHKHIMTHTGEKKHKCPHCDFKATQKSSLTVHIRKHTGERPYSCDLCPQQCTSKSNLIAHKRRHLGLKQYECLICNKKFGYKLSLEEHISSTHERSQTYPCQLCGASYTRTRGLRRHLLAKHGGGVTADAAEANLGDVVDVCNVGSENEKRVDEKSNKNFDRSRLKEVLIVKNEDSDVYLL